MSTLLQRLFATALLFGLLIIALLNVPARWVLPDEVSRSVTPLVGSTLGKGSALVSRSDGVSGSLKWHWCPSRGVSALCLEFSGVDGWFAATYHGLGLLDIDSLTLSSQGLARTWPSALAEIKPVSMSLQHFSLTLNDQCPVIGVLSAQGTMTLMRRGSSSKEELRLNPQSDGSSQIDGRYIQGVLVREGKNVSLRAVINEDAGNALSLQLPCHNLSFDRWI